MTRQPYQKERPCPKCGEKGAVTIHLEADKYREKYECKRLTKAEHLHRYCQNCHYEWCEALAIPAPETPTPEEVALDG